MSIGKSLSMRVVAEGVESGSQAEILDKLSCDELQGYYFAKPMAREDVASYLAPVAEVRDTSRRRAG